MGKTASFKTTIEFVTISGKSTFVGRRTRTGKLLPELRTVFHCTSARPDLVLLPSGTVTCLFDPDLRCIVEAKSVCEAVDDTNAKPKSYRLVFHFDAVPMAGKKQGKSGIASSEF